MPTEVEQLRDIARDYWSDRDVICPKHPGVRMTGTFVQTTFTDHVFLTCPRGKETITIPQRPRQLEFQHQQVEGMVESLVRGDAILCYRCQSSVETSAQENVDNGVTDYTFTCIRCLSFGTWRGHPEAAKIGSAPTAGTRKKSNVAATG